jgi:prevent-host-death family protein
MMVAIEERSPMQQKLSTLRMRKNLGEILNRVALRHDEFIIERKGHPLAAMVPVEKLRQLERLARLHLLEALETRPAQPSPAEADALADEAKHAKRKDGSR